MKSVILCPGQGAQYCGMGRDFYEGSQRMRHLFEEASDLLQKDLFKQVFESDEMALQKSSLCQIAIFLVTYGIYLEVQQQLPFFVPNFALGLSLGEYSALAISQKAALCHLLPIVQKRGRCMQKAALEHPSGMMAVLGLSEEKLSSFLKDIENVWICNYNTFDQIVIGGAVCVLEGIRESLLALGARRAVFLQVAGAFHTPLMQNAAKELQKDLLGLPLTSSSIALLSNYTGLAYPEDLFSIREGLLAQMVHPTRFAHCIATLEKQEPNLYIELGPGKMLSAMARKMKVCGEIVSVDRIEDIEILAQALFAEGKK